MGHLHRRRDKKSWAAAGSFPKNYAHAGKVD